MPQQLANCDEVPPAAMSHAFAKDITQLRNYYESGTDLVAVQGPVSSMKTWLLTCTAEAFMDQTQRVAALVPQKVNRRSLVERLEKFGVPYVEKPARRDLCSWEPWQEMVGRVDEHICSSNGCPMYPDNRDMEQLAAEALAMHRLEAGDTVQLDKQTVKDLAHQIEQPVCPHYLQEALDEMIENKVAVRVATYAKAFETADTGDWLSTDVVLMDESHTAATNLERSAIEIDLSTVKTALAAIHEQLKGGSSKRTREVAHGIESIKFAVYDWEAASWERPITPDELFAEMGFSLSDAFNVLSRADNEIKTELRRAVRSEHSDLADLLSKVDRHLRNVIEFLSYVQSYQDGDLDFIHTRYRAQGEAVNEIAFRRVSNRGAGSTPSEIYEAWCEMGTDPAIATRWGDLLDHHIEAVWSGRRVVPGGDRVVPGTPPPPLTELQSITGADTLIGYSATHNEMSDPGRSLGDLRRTSHRLVTAPIQLRSDGDERSDYHGRTSVDAATPWFRKLVHWAKEETDARLAAVPINGSNEAKWGGMPVETLELPEGRDRTSSQVGLVPHSRGAIGDKGLENLSIDAVLCGVQAQSPADTARLVVDLWEFLAPEHDDPATALERGWRILAQHVVSGTIQAAGRFQTNAINIIFERPELIELAGFEYEHLSPSMDGFAGTFATGLEEMRSRFTRQRDGIRAARIVAYLEESSSKAPTRAQYLSKFREVYNGTEQKATQAFEAAVEAGRVEYTSGMLRSASDGEAGDGPDG